VKLITFKPEGHKRNFGDDLNSLLWEKFLPELSRTDIGFCGIGTVLTEPFDTLRPMVVFGSGAGYTRLPNLQGVDVRFVRGPKTARLVGHMIGKEVRHITDPAILMALLLSRQNVEFDVSFMPHWTTLVDDEDLPNRLEAINVHVIDPRWETDVVLDQISKSRKLIAGAMHGAIVADALRIPWIPAYLSTWHTFKWIDWSNSMELAYDPADLNVQSFNAVLATEEPRLSDSNVFENRIKRITEEVERLRRELC